MLFYTELETFALKCKFNSKILAPLCKFLAAPLMHSILYCEVLASRTLPREMKEVLILSIEIVNYMKAGFRNSRLFKLLCQDMESEHAAMLFYINVRRLSKGNMLKRLHELKEVKVFLDSRKKKKLLAKFNSKAFNNHWLILWT